MPAQTSYTIDPPIAREGMLADGQYTVFSKLVGEADGIPAGRVVVHDPDATDPSDRKAYLPRDTADVTSRTWGISIYDAGKMPNTPEAEFEVTYSMPIARTGRVWMVSEDAVVVGGPVFVRFVATDPEELGRVRSDADGADAVALPGARFITNAGAGELVQVEINIP